MPPGTFTFRGTEIDRYAKNSGATMAKSDQNFTKFRNSLRQQEESSQEAKDGLKKIEMETQKNVEDKIRSILGSREKAVETMQKTEPS